MKKYIGIFLTAIITFVSAGCSLFTDEYIPDGFISADEFADTKGIQDHADYCKYYYSENNTLFSDNKAYSQVENIDDISSYFENFEEIISQTDRSESYDFDVNVITADDFVHIETKEGELVGFSPYAQYEKYDNYSVYLYDTESCILYYIHSNI